MGPVQTLLLVAIIFVVVVGAAAIGGAVLIRARRPEMERALNAPFTYGVAPVPVTASNWSRPATVAGLPATISIWDPRRDPRISSANSRGMRGWLAVELPLGPQWPLFVVMPRSPLQGLGVLIAKQQHIAGTAVLTGDPEFDGAFWTGYKAGELGDDASVRAVHQVLGPQVRAELSRVGLSRLSLARKLGVHVWLDTRFDVEQQITVAASLAELIVHSSGIPVHQGPPQTFESHISL